MKANVLVLTLSGMFATAALAARGAIVEIHPSAFDGGWKTDVQFMDVMGSPYLLAHGAGHRVLDSVAVAEVPHDGEWHVWVRTRTWVDAKGFEPAPSAFRVAVNGRDLEKTVGLGGDRWHWEDVGTVRLAKGPAKIALRDLSGFDARCAGVVLADAGERPEGALGILDKPAAETVTADLVVVGGGVPGTCAAIAAARSGLRVALVQDRPFLGGNASREIRVWSAGEIANDIVREVRGRFMNMEAEAAIGDEWRQRIVQDEANIDCRLCHRAFATEKDGDRIAAVRALDWKRNRIVRFAAPLFVDATGDGWIGFFAGAEFRMGREAKSEFGETMAPEKADGDTLGSSLMWTSLRAGTDEPFSAPWAEPWAQGESAVHGEWNWEYGIHRDIIAEGEEIRDRLLAAIYGAFSNAKKRPENCRQVLNFVPYLLGKRESRRLVGDYVYSEQDVTEKRVFDDAVAKGSWSIDLHYDTCKPGVDFLTVCRQPLFGRYYIPFRSCYSKNVPNLMMAGRCFSCTHVGLGGPRVINTLSMLGVACGYAAAECKAKGILPREVYTRGLVRGIQRKLGGDWPGNPDPTKAGWLIVDDEDMSVKHDSTWSQVHNHNGSTWNDRMSIGNAGGAKRSSPLVFPLPVAKRGAYLLKRHMPFEPGWFSKSLDAMTTVEVKSGKETRRFTYATYSGGAEWTDLGIVGLEPGATLTVLPAESKGEIIADAFAAVPLPDEGIVSLNAMKSADLSGDTANQIVIAAGTPEVYEGHPTTIATRDGRIIAVWCTPHGGACGPAAETKDGGRTWTRIDDRFPKDYRLHANCPSIYRLEGPDGKSRLFIWSQLKMPEGMNPTDYGARRKYMQNAMPAVVSEDEGITWKELNPLGEKYFCVMAFSSVVRLRDGSYLGLYHSGPGGADHSPLVVKQVVSKDGGFSWSEPRTICAVEGKNPCEPCVFRSPDGSELCCLMRENTHKGRSLMMFSRDEGVTWTKAVDTSWGLTGDRHEIVRLADGRFFCAFRDMAPGSPTYGDFVAWIGDYASIRKGTDEGAMRIRILHHYASKNHWIGDCGYSGLTELPDGDILAVTYVHYRDDNCWNSVIATIVPGELLKD